MKKVKELKNKVLSAIKKVTVMATTFLLLNPPLIARADNETTAGGALAGTKLVSGFKKLIGDATLILVGLCAAVVVLICIKEGYLYFTGEEEEKPKHKKNIKMTIIIGVLIMCASGLVSVIFGYFS